MNTVYLAGSEDVSRAGSQMVSAASDFNQAASNMAYALEMHQRFLDDWMARFEAVVAALAKDGGANG